MAIQENSPLEYYKKLEELHVIFCRTIDFPHAYLKFSLPFELPCLEGIYKIEDSAIFLRHHAISNDRASFKTGDCTVVETMYSPTGLYKQTTVEIILPGRPEINDVIPPSDSQIYKNISSCPTAVLQANVLLNKLITGLRRESGRCDIPDVVPAYINKLEFVQYNEKGEIEISKPFLSLEYIRISEGFPNISNTIHMNTKSMPALPFYIELLESAKFHFLSYNLRRSILDFCGAWEAFVDINITPFVENNSANTKDKFLKIYNDLLDRETRIKIRKIINGSDKSSPLSVLTIAARYNHTENKKLLNRHENSIKKIFLNYRNDAAHGKEISQDLQKEIQGKLLVGIESFDKIINEWDYT